MPGPANYSNKVIISMIHIEQATLRQGVCEPSTEGSAALTYVCFMADVRALLQGRDFGYPGVPLLGVAAEFVNCVLALQDGRDAEVDWLGGEEPLHLARAGADVTLKYVRSDEVGHLPLTVFAASVVAFVAATTELVESRFPALLENMAYLEFEAELMQNSQAITAALP